MTVHWERAVVLSVAEFDVAWELLDLGVTPAALDVPSPGGTHAERDRIVRDVLCSLHDRALTRGSAPVPALAADLRTLAVAGAVRDLVVTAPVRYAAVAATDGPACVLAVRLDARVALVRIPPAHAAAEVVGLVGPVRPGPGPAVRIPVRVMHDAAESSGGDRNRLTTELMRRGVDGPDAAAVGRMGELVGMGQLGAGRRDGNAMRRAPWALLLHITDHGVYRQRRIPRDGTDPMVEAGPVDAPTLTRELDELVAAAERPDQRRGAGRGSTRPADAGGTGSDTGAGTW